MQTSTQSAVNPILFQPGKTAFPKLPFDVGVSLFPQSRVWCRAIARIAAG